MLRVLIDKEMREMIGSTKFALTFAVCAILIILSFYIGAANYKVAVEHHRAAKAENLQQLEGVTDWLMVRQNRIFLPPQPLAALVTGISNDIGRTTEVEARGELTAHDSRFNEEPIFAVFRFLDLSFIFTVVLSLFAILLGYDAISGEKERGTLKLILANAVPRSTYILGKLIGSFAALSVSLLIAICIGCLLLPMMGVPMASADWMRLGLIILTGLLYFGVFLTISMFVSATTQRTSNSFLLLLVVWVVSVLVIPRASVLTAGRAVEVPSVDEIGAKKASYASELWKDFRHGMASFKGPETEDVQTIMDVFNKYMDSLTTIRDDKMNLYASQLNEERHNRQLTQQAVAFNIARLSPVASMTLATEELAGTSLELKNRYYDQAMAYQKIYAEFLKEKTGMNVGGRMIMIKIGGDDEEEAEPIDPNELPLFVYEPPSVANSVQAAAGDIGLLGLLNILFFAASFVSFRRYDAR
jgi:ABC-type transport system involved in multi-copper enzyme maturation permease subunit